VIVAGFVIWALTTEQSPDNDAAPSPATTPSVQSLTRDAPPNQTTTPTTTRPTDANPELQAPEIQPASTTVQAAHGLSPEEFDIARWTPLSFYPSTELWEFSRWGSDSLAAYLVPFDGSPILLDGTAAPIHAYNARVGLDLMDPAVAADYLRFFTAFVWSEKGAFTIIETRSALPSSAQHKTSVQLKGLRLNPTGETFETSAIIVYGDALFDARFRLQRHGMVEMLDDQPVATAISPDVVFASGQRRPATLAGLQPGNWPLPPPVPGDWSNAVSEDLVRIRQLILSDRER
jgi:hypothetical protein